MICKYYAILQKGLEPLDFGIQGSPRLINMKHLLLSGLFHLLAYASQLHMSAIISFLFLMSIQVYICMDHRSFLYLLVE